MIEGIKKLSKMQPKLAQQAYASYLPLVDDIIKSKKTKKIHFLIQMKTQVFTE
jgi:hypothetical protein